MKALPQTISWMAEMLLQKVERVQTMQGKPDTLQ